MSSFIPKNLIEEIVSRTDIVQIVSEYLSLKRSGANYIALCPFHDEKTPSFSVSPDKQIYHCFGCGVGGNVINFIMNIEKLDFVEAVSLLAEKAGVNLYNAVSDDVQKGIVNERKILYEINKTAAEYFNKNLFSFHGKEAIDYLTRRGITKDTIEIFKIGYAIKEWQDLTDFLIKKGFKQKYVVKSGLAVPRKNRKGCYDRFRDRIIIPIFDHIGKIIGFGGRVLDHSLPKYLNTPETLVFDKGSMLFNINNAKSKLENGYIIIVEGYMDVISLYQEGIKNVVASLGTSLTQGQANLIKRYSNNIIIAYDGDVAGQKATLRGMDVLDEAGCNVSVINFPKGMDPDDYIKKMGHKKFYDLINTALPLIDYKLSVIQSRYNLDTVQGRSEYAADAANLINNIKSSIKKDAYIKKIQQQTGISSTAIYDYINRSNKKNIIGNNRYNKNGNQKDVFVSANLLAEKGILKAIIEDMDSFRYVSNILDYEQFSDENNRIIAEYIYKRYRSNEKVVPSVMISDLADNVSSDFITSIIEMDTTQFTDKIKFIDDCIKRVIEYDTNNEIRKIQEQIRLLEKQKGDVDKIEILLNRLMTLKQHQIDCRRLEGGKSIE